MPKLTAVYLDTRSWTESIQLYPTPLDAYEALAELFELDLTEAPTETQARIEYLNEALQPHCTRLYVTEVEVPA